MYVIYKAENKINGKCYIGYTSDLQKRIYQHKISSYAEYRFIFQKAIVDFGFSNFTWESIDSCETEQDAREKERHYIKLYKSNIEGYNSPNFFREDKPMIKKDVLMERKPTHTVSLTKELSELLLQEAQDNYLSVSGQISYIISQYFKMKEKKAS